MSVKSRAKKRIVDKVPPQAVVLKDAQGEQNDRFHFVVRLNRSR